MAECARQSAADTNIQPVLTEAAEQALRNACLRDIEIANQRWQIIQSGSDCSPRTLRGWRSLYRQAEQRFGCGSGADVLTSSANEPYVGSN